MPYKYRIYFPITDTEKDIAGGPWQEFDSRYIDAGVVRNFDDYEEIDIFNMVSLFDKISDKMICSIELSYVAAGCDLKTTSWLSMRKERGETIPLIIEVGHDDQSKDTLLYYKVSEVSVNELILTHSGAIAVFFFVQSGEIVKSPT
jgi:hypothetical protein